MKPCTVCDGYGFQRFYNPESASELEPCKHCNGEGMVFENEEEQRLYEVLWQ